jgi:hypothetical protein
LIMKSLERCQSLWPILLVKKTHICQDKWAIITVGQMQSNRNLRLEYKLINPDHRFTKETEASVKSMKKKKMTIGFLLQETERDNQLGIHGMMSIVSSKKSLCRVKSIDHYSVGQSLKPLSHLSIQNKNSTYSTIW